MLRGALVAVVVLVLVRLFVGASVPGRVVGASLPPVPDALHPAACCLIPSNQGLYRSHE